MTVADNPLLVSKTKYLLGQAVALKIRQSELDAAVTQVTEQQLRTDGALALLREVLGDDAFKMIVENFNADQGKADKDDTNA